MLDPKQVLRKINLSLPLNHTLPLWLLVVLAQRLKKQEKNLVINISEFRPKA